MKTPVRHGSRRRQAEHWLLALSSQGIEGRLAYTPQGWTVYVTERDSVEAGRVLETYERENVRPARRGPTIRDWGSSSAGFIIAGGLLLFYLVTGPRDPAIPYFERGSASAALILEGEVWRTVTALTLHADLPHVFANTLFMAVFATAVCVSLGPGLGSFLLLLAGASGNTLNALIQDPVHSSVGASTAIFGAIGILAGLRVGRRHAPAPRTRRLWIPIAAGFALLAMLGMGERSDILAHTLGLVAGLVLGWAVGAVWVAPPGVMAQGLYLLIALGVVLGAWSFALAGSGVLPPWAQLS